MWNLSGQLVGYQHYRPDADKLLKNSPKEGRYFTYMTKVDGRVMLGVWGLESLDFKPDVLFVVEGVFKAVPFHNRRLPAIATLSNHPKQLRNFLWILSQTRQIVFVGDNDAGGKTTTKSMGYEMVLPPPHVKDADELTPEEFDAWINGIMENLK